MAYMNRVIKAFVTQNTRIIFGTLPKNLYIQNYSLR